MAEQSNKQSNHELYEFQKGDHLNRPKYAVFLPAISTFYNTAVSRQRHNSNYVPKERIPTKLTKGVEGLNFLDPNKSVFYYPWGLHSAGHAQLDVTQDVPKESMIRDRPRDGTSFMLGDSGGFQIGKGKWEGEWRDPTGPEVAAEMAKQIAKGVDYVDILDQTGNKKLDKNGNPRQRKIDHAKIYQAKLDAAQEKRKQVLNWMDAYMDYGIILDIPAWVSRSPAGIKATGITSYQEAVNATKYNNQFFIENRTGACKFLNVLQGETHADAEDWYQQMKDFCDPKKYDKHFNGWAMGGQNMCDIHLILKRLVALHFDGLLQEGVHDWMHFLGTSKMEWAVLLTDLQNAVRKYYNPNFTISFDCASPFLANANGLIYTNIRLEDKQKWIYKMEPSIDDRKYSSDTRSLRDGLLQEKIVTEFEDSPISELLQVKDICIYPPKQANKMGVVSKTSWDSFSYALQMGHNTWLHILAVQRANDAYYNKGMYPAMLIDERFERIVFRDIIDNIFSKTNRAEAEAEIEKHDRFYLRIIGQRGAVGKKTLNSKTSFNENMEVIPPSEVIDLTELLAKEEKEVLTSLAGFNKIVEIIPPSNPIEIVEEVKEKEVLTTEASFNSMFGEK